MTLTEAQLERIKSSGIKGPETRIPFPVPFGWFAVAQSNDLGPGETKNAHYFGRDLVVWREEETGTPHVVDAYCAHLGAHLGVGAGSPESHEPGPGIVKGSCLECPFHGWRYDGTGAVVEIPYSTSSRIPSKAGVRGYEVQERNGLINAWYHPHDEPSMWSLPELPEFSDPDWIEPIYSDRYIGVSLQEIYENDVDTVHFFYVHGTEEIPDQASDFSGGRVRTTTTVRPDGKIFSRETHQLGFGVLHIEDTLAFVASSSPLDADHIHQRWIFSFPKVLGDQGHELVDSFSKRGIYQDIPIWEHKAYRANPVIVKGDGRILDYRRWAGQFYA